MKLDTAKQLRFPDRWSWRAMHLNHRYNERLFNCDINTAKQWGLQELTTPSRHQGHKRECRKQGYHPATTESLWHGQGQEDLHFCRLLQSCEEEEEEEYCWEKTGDRSLQSHMSEGNFPFGDFYFIFFSGGCFRTVVGAHDIQNMRVYLIFSLTSLSPPCRWWHTNFPRNKPFPAATRLLLQVAECYFVNSVNIQYSKTSSIWISRDP